MLRLRILNVSSPGNDTMCSYHYEVDVNGRGIADGYVINHLRNDGWVALVKRIVEQEEAKAALSQEAMSDG